MKAFIPFLAILFLASCQKDNDTKPSGTNGLTGTAKTVNEIVWGKEAPAGSNHLVIDETSEFLNTETGEIVSFKVETASAFTSTNEDEGSGVSYSGGVNKITIVESELNANQLRVRCFIGEKEVMGRWWNY